MNLYEMDPWDVHGWVIDLIAATEFTYVPGGEILAGDPVTDTDGDGVLDVVENTAGLQVCSCPPDGDGNGDGTDDRLQSNVSSRPSFYGGSITYASASGTILSGLRVSDPWDHGPVPEDYDILAGLSEVNVHGVDVGGSTVLRLPTVYRRSVDGFVVVDGSNWTLLPPANVATDPNGYWTDLTLIDGGLGDLDGAANGSIFVRGARIYYEDTAPPVVQCDTPPTGWSAGDVSVSCTAFDLQGMPSEYEEAFELFADVPRESRPTPRKRRHASCATGRPVHNCGADRRDQSRRRDPSIATSLPPGVTIEQGGTLEADFSCTDSGSGVASCVGTVDDGDLLDTSTVGARTRSRSSPPIWSATSHRVRSNTSSKRHPATTTGSAKPSRTPGRRR